jgi:hypothetical protein
MIPHSVALRGDGHYTSVSSEGALEDERRTASAAP